MTIVVTDMYQDDEDLDENKLQTQVKTACAV